MRIRRNDTVQVVSGDEKGKSGRVRRILPNGRLEIEGINLVWKHLRRSQQHPHGARIQREASLSASNVMLVCPACKKPVRAGTGRDESGAKIRVCRRCKGALPAPTE